MNKTATMIERDTGKHVYGTVIGSVIDWEGLKFWEFQTENGDRYQCMSDYWELIHSDLRIVSSYFETQKSETFFEKLANLFTKGVAK